MSDLDLNKPLITEQGEPCFVYDKGDGYTFSARLPDGQVHLFYSDGTVYHNEDVAVPSIINGSVN